MTLAAEHQLHAIQLFEPDGETIYTIEAAANIAQVTRRSILVYYKHGLVSPVGDPEGGGILLQRRGHPHPAPYRIPPQPMWH